MDWETWKQTPLPDSLQQQQHRHQHQQQQQRQDDPHTPDLIEMDDHQSSYLSHPVNPLHLDEAIQNSQLTFVKEEFERNLVAKQAHNSDLYKTQQAWQGMEKGDVLIFVSYPTPSCNNKQGCQKSTFQTSRVILTRDQVLNTKSEKLNERLNSESHQRRAKRRAAPLPPGVTHVLDLSPPDGEDDYTLALQRLSVSQGIRLWYRASAFGASIEAVAGHDDVCSCKEGYDTAYPIPTPPISIQGQKSLEGMSFAAFLLDTETWPIDDHHEISDFCHVRHGANVLRLFRSLANGDLHIDSAPRMWTLVGLFDMFEMTNYDLIRDEVVTWFNAGNNYIFVEILPEEALRIASIIRAPVIAFAAFRILVNEHALVIAGGHVHEQARKNTTIFGRRKSGCLSGTEQADAVMRMVEHAGVAMAERYKKAIDNISGPDALAILEVPEWEQLTLLDNVIPKDLSLSVRRTYDELLKEIRDVVSRFVTKCLDTPRNNRLLSQAAKSRWATSETGLSYLVSKHDLVGEFSPSTVYSGLNRYQRALCPFVWLELRDLFISDHASQQDVYGAAAAFSDAFDHAERNKMLLPGPRPKGLAIHLRDTYRSLFQNAKSKLSDYAAAFSRRSDEFGYSITQHMVLSLSEKEMDYLRFGDETVYETDIPEAELGPTGPGPAFHTGITVPSASDSVVNGMDGMAIVSDDGRSTIVGSVTAQDSFSTVYGRNRVLTPSASMPSERFTDDAMSADVAEAEFAVPAEHQSRGQALAAYVEAEQEDLDDGLRSEEDFYYDDDDSEAFNESELSIDEGDDDLEDFDEQEDDLEIITHDEAATAATQPRRAV
ncbi:hypothetical protein KVR01_012674 [Diaporthe batatas]|uniref:uncharacterized protein n=1 Tax=Diaporthe batatas TaxID=748121 RepID=UPI001D055FD8|nr:uncharacterized protein KVR01_012674 [Diaporthe batatas]KAG8157632.1 hypothetical protein KVR01_012674 [Diaporthe batatas]